MSAFVCDICGGKLKVINGKMAVCESCGMEHSLERIREKYRESQEVVHVDNAHLISNYFAMAQDAYDAGNKSEAEKYCNKIIEIDSADADALLLKGKAVGWQSAIGSFRFKEAALCFANAINCCATETEKEEMNSSIQDEFRGLATALIKLRCDRFQKYPDDEEARGFKNDLSEVSDAINIYTQQTREEIDKNYVFGSVSATVHFCMTMVSLTIALEYRISGSKLAYSTLLKKTENCIDIIKKTIDLCDDDDNSDAELYQLMIDMIKTLINNNRSDLVSDRWGAFKETPRLSASELSKFNDEISAFESQINKIKTDK